MFRNAISFPLCRVMEILFNKYCVSRDSRVTCVILLSRSATSSAASLFHGPPVSMAIGTKWCVAVRQAYFVDLLTAAFVYYYYYCYSYCYCYCYHYCYCCYYYYCNWIMFLLMVDVKPRQTETDKSQFHLFGTRRIVSKTESRCKSVRIGDALLVPPDLQSEILCRLVLEVMS